MAAPRHANLRRKRAKTLDTLQLRLWLSPGDTARLRELQTDDEGPADTIRQLIRTAAMVKPILDLLQQRPLGPAPAAQAPPTQDDAVQRQLDAVAGWALGDDD